MAETKQRVAFASAARTATPAPFDYSNCQAVGLRAIINVTAVGVTPSVVFNIDAYDWASDTWVTLLASAAIVANGTTVLRVFPGATAAANLTVNDRIGSRYRIRPVHGNAVTITYSVGVEELG